MTPLRRLALALLLFVPLAAVDGPHPRARSVDPEASSPEPSDWFGAQRAFPRDTIAQQRWLAALAHARVEFAARALPAATQDLEWHPIGPSNIGGRVSAIAGSADGDTLYLGAADGGVFRSTDLGRTWRAIFDQVAVPSIGALAVAPGDANTVYAGTGEANTAIDNYDGAGVFRTRNGGDTWESLGLTATRRIARIAVDPLHPERLYVAAMGSQYSTGPDRGLYCSSDSGATWQRTLFVDDSTGVCDVAVNPAHPETVFCATWERVRRASYRRASGPGCGIWRSTDAGATWSRLANGLPQPSDSVGRIALAIAPSRPSTIYAQVTAGATLNYQGLGLYRSTDGGASWQRRDLSGFTGAFGGFGWYFGSCAVAPNDPERCYALGVPLLRSTDGGATYVSSAGATHVDQHAIYLPPERPDRVFLGNDGGFFTSTDGGQTWSGAPDLPITQFYANAVDPAQLARVLGGSQDNGTVITTGAADGWSTALDGDGFFCLVDPTNPSVVFAEYQNGSGGSGPLRSSDGGNSFTYPSGIAPSDRFNWCAPFVMSPLNHNVILAGSQRVWRSTDNGQSYIPISGDLSTHPAAALVYGTITTLAISPLDTDLYFAGTDDGNVWRSEDGGATWTRLLGLPQRWVTRIACDPTDRASLYVTLSGFAEDEHAAHVYASADVGDSWTAVSGNLPDAPVNDLLVDPQDPSILYVASDVGVWTTRDRGADWFPLGRGLPPQVVMDLALHAPSHTLIAATHGRSQWSLAIGGLPLAVGAAPVARPSFALAGPNPARAITRLALEVRASVAVEVSLFDPLGRRVRALYHGTFAPGRHLLTWDGRDARGQRVPPGVYFARAASGDWSALTRVVRID